MKTKLWPILLILLPILFSCSVTKRRYLPGYNVIWGHKAPNTTVASTPKTESKLMNHSCIKSFVTMENAYTPTHLQIPGPKSLTSPTRVEAGHSELLMHTIIKNNLAVVTPVDSVRKGMMVCKQANISLISSILAFVILETLGILTRYNSSVAIFVLFLVNGFGFALLAIIFGELALKIIKNNPGKYKGKEKAVWGIVLGVILLIILGFVSFLALIFG